jgi:hypothetical protein
MLSFRVTRLGEFSPIGRLFSLGSLLKITEVAQHSGLLFSSFQFLYKFRQKMAWVTIWAISSQTHLVTMLSFYNRHKELIEPTCTKAQKHFREFVKSRCVMQHHIM